MHIIYMIEAVGRRCSVKKVYVKISQNSQENNSARDLQLCVRAATLLNKRP